LFNTLGTGYKRFKKEIERAKKSNIRLVIIIEGSMLKVLKGIASSEMKGISVIRKLFTLWIKHDVNMVFCNSREEMARYIYESFCAIGRLMKKDNSNIKDTYASIPTLSRQRDIPVIRQETGSDNRGAALRE
jgi:hypothetical protein